MNTSLIRQKGLTLLEAALATLIIAVLLIIGVSIFKGGAVNTQKANALNEIASKLAHSWSVLADSCNLKVDITSAGNAAGTVITGSPSVARLNLALLLGTTYPTATYTSCYTSSGIKQLKDVGKGAFNAEKTNLDYAYGDPVYVSINNNNYIGIVIAGVPEEVVLELFKKLSRVTGASTATSVPALADTTDQNIRFTVASGGVRTVTLLKLLLI